MIVVAVASMAVRSMIAEVVAMATEGGTTNATETVIVTAITTMTMIVVVFVEMIVMIIQEVGDVLHHHFTNPRLSNAFSCRHHSYDVDTTICDR